MSKKLFILAAALALLAAACSSSEESSPDPTTDDTTASSVDDTADDTTDGTEPPDESADGPCPSENEIELSNSEGSDGPIEPGSAFADVTFESADIVISSYEIPEDPQFGMAAPVGDPEAPEGGVIFQVSLFPGVDEEELLVGTYVDDGEAEPRIDFISLYDGSERLLPLGDHTVEITEITDERICGEITAETDPNDFQSFPVVTGRFIVEVV